LVNHLDDILIGKQTLTNTDTYIHKYIHKKNQIAALI